MIKMVVSDFDMTLINYKDGFNEYQISILKRLKENGFVFTLVTGRNVSFFDMYPELLMFTDYIISSNGGAIYDVNNNKYLYNSCINDNSFNQLVEIGIDNNYTFVIYELSKVYKYGNLKELKSIIFDKRRQYSSEQIVFYVENNRMDKFIETINEFNDVVVNNVNKKNGRCSFDINNKNVSKGNGLSFLCDYLNISLDEIIAFGDGENDVSMFKVVDKCVCVANACEVLKSMTNEITYSCSENGVFKYIEENLLK